MVGAFVLRPGPNLIPVIAHFGASASAWFFFDSLHAFPYTAFGTFVNHFLEVFGVHDERFITTLLISIFTNKIQLIEYFTCQLIPSKAYLSICSL